MAHSRPKGCPERRAVQGPERYRQRHPANRPVSGWRVPRKGTRAGPAVRVCVRRRGHSTLPAVGKPPVRSLYPRNRHRDGADRGGTSFSLSDTRGVRETFNIFRFEEAEVNYICSNGKNLKSGEVLIRNF